MSRALNWLRILAVPVVATMALSMAVHQPITAADHFDPPARVGTVFGSTIDVAADIADLYAFHDAANVYIALDFGGPSDPATPPFYDRNVLYTINVSNDGARSTVEMLFEIRFGRDGQFNGVQVTGLPPDGRTVSGPVEVNLNGGNGVLVRAGLFDDPFFFDQMGLGQTRQTGNLSFNNTRNPFGNRNTTFVVLQIPRGLIDRGQPLDFWATSARIGS